MSNLMEDYLERSDEASEFGWGKETYGKRDESLHTVPPDEFEAVVSFPKPTLEGNRPPNVSVVTGRTHRDTLEELAD